MEKRFFRILKDRSCRIRNVKSVSHNFYPWLHKNKHFRSIGRHHFHLSNTYYLSLILPYKKTWKVFAFEKILRKCFTTAQHIYIHFLKLKAVRFMLTILGLYQAAQTWNNSDIWIQKTNGGVNKFWIFYEKLNPKTNLYSDSNSNISRRQWQNAFLKWMLCKYYLKYIWILSS